MSDIESVFTNQTAVSVDESFAQSKELRTTTSWLGKKINSLSTHVIVSIAVVMGVVFLVSVSFLFLMLVGNSIKKDAEFQFSQNNGSESLSTKRGAKLNFQLIEYKLIRQTEYDLLMCVKRNLFTCSDINIRSIDIRLKSENGRFLAYNLMNSIISFIPSVSTATYFREFFVKKDVAMFLVRDFLNSLNENIPHYRNAIRNYISLEGVFERFNTRQFNPLVDPKDEALAIKSLEEEEDRSKRQLGFWLGDDNYKMYTHSLLLAIHTCDQFTSNLDEYGCTREDFDKYNDLNIMRQKEKDLKDPNWWQKLDIPKSTSTLKIGANWLFNLS